MPTIQEIQALANGQNPTINSQMTGAQTIVVQNNNGINGINDGSCLSCDDNAPCEVRPTQAVAFDNGSFSLANQYKNRFNIIGGEAISHLTFMSNLTAQNITHLPRLAPLITPNFFTAGVGGTVNGSATAEPVQEQNLILAGGAVACRIVVNYNSSLVANAGLNDLLITQFKLPIGINNSVVSSTEYTPFCDSCFTNNNGSRTTHTYTGNFPTTFREGFDFTVPPFSNFTAEITYGIVNLSNALASTPATQWGAC